MFHKIFEFRKFSNLIIRYYLKILFFNHESLKCVIKIYSVKNKKSFDQIFNGLCQLGAWGCFDEFNRLSCEIMSSVSPFIYKIQSKTLSQQKRPADFENSELEIFMKGKKTILNPTTSIFLTMNPNYTGRNFLPDNLSQLFFKISVLKPNIEEIICGILNLLKFEEADNLTSVLTNFYE